MSLLIALDQSTSATKAVLVDATGCVLDRASRDHRQIYPQAGWVEHDAGEIWTNVLAVIAEVAERNAGALFELAGVSIANQRETFVVFDRATGEPLHNAIVWQCRRGAPICRELVDAGHEPNVQAKTGLKLDTYFPAAKIAWLLRERPDLAARLRDGSAAASTIDAYLVHRLTGGDVFATDHTNASRTLLYNVNTLGWDAELCELFGVPLDALPEVRESAARFGATNAQGALPRTVPICGVMGDSQASLFAQRCFEPGQGKATFGTGTSVMLNVGHEPLPSTPSAVLALAWVLDGQPTYAYEGLINYSAATIAWVRDQLGLIADVGESETLAREVADNGGVYLVPAFAGLSAPHWRPDARAAIVGMSGHTSRAHLVRAALESIAYQLRDVLDALRAESGVAPQTLAVDGGPTRNAFLMQFIADLTRVELRVADAPESSALGAAQAGMIALGLRTAAELAREARSSVSYAPQMPAAEADALYAGWQQAVQRVLL
ncbi:MAG: glycerol kinase GlpK [Planctomycetales bacterium]|nr:glycerol kinase GlpK [Planctomycetales bacterium]